MVRELSGVSMHTGLTPQTYRTAEVARILGVPAARVRTIARAGVCQPVRLGRALQFSFQDLVLLRAADGLLRAAVPPRRLRRALSQLAQQLPPERPLSGVRIYANSRRVVARDGRTAWQPDSGQIVFSFDIDELARAARTTAPARSARDSASPPLPKPAQSALAWFERALRLERKNDLAGAAAAYRRALDIDPEMSDACINLGRLLHQQGNAAEAARLYHLALASAPDDPVGHYNLAVALEDQQRDSAAVSHYRRALRLDPDFADAHFNLGRLLERLGQRTQAMRHLLAYKRLTDAE